MATIGKVPQIVCSLGPCYSSGDWASIREPWGSAMQEFHCLPSAFAGNLNSITRTVYWNEAASNSTTVPCSSRHLKNASNPSAISCPAPARRACLTFAENGMLLHRSLCLTIHHDITSAIWKHACKVSVFPQPPSNVLSPCQVNQHWLAHAKYPSRHKTTS
jgi:hypothetical protein